MGPTVCKFLLLFQWPGFECQRGVASDEVFVYINSVFFVPLLTSGLDDCIVHPDADESHKHDKGPVLVSTFELSL